MRAKEKNHKTKDFWNDKNYENVGSGHSRRKVETIPEQNPLQISHLLLRELADIRKAGKEMTYLRPDAKSQVAVQYNNNYQPQRIDSVVFSSQHNPALSLEQLRELILEDIIYKSLPKDLIDNKTKFFINPAGRFEIGGPVGDCGLTGRKIIVDTYGGMARHGGGAFFGGGAPLDRKGAPTGGGRPECLCPPRQKYVPPPLGVGIPNTTYHCRCNKTGQNKKQMGTRSSAKRNKLNKYI